MYLFIFSSPQEWILVIVAGFMLFGANRLPELAKSLGKTRKAFKEGLEEGEGKSLFDTHEASTPDNKPNISHFDDETLLEEIRRRKEQGAPTKMIN